MKERYHILTASRRWAAATLMAIAATWCALPAGAQVNAEQMMRVGQNALYFEDYMLSIQYFNQAIQAKPYLAQPYFYRAIAKLNLDDYRGAETDASEAIERNPFITDAYEVRGVARQNMEKLPEAVDDYRHALSLQPNSRGILYNMAFAQQDMDDLTAADSTFTLLLKQFPGYENGYVGRARLRLAQADTIGAKADLDHALAINGKIATAYMLRAQIAIHQAADYAAAKEDLDEAIKLQPRQAGLYVNRAFLRYNLDDYFGAMADYDYALQLDPLNAVALYNRGLLRAEVHDNDKAIADFTAALRLDDKDYRSRYNRALLRRDTRDFNGAIADIDVIIEAFPELPEARYLRSDILRQMGQTAKAERDYNQARALTRALKSTEADDQTDMPENLDDPRLTAGRFRELLTIDNEVDSPEEYNNKSIRGRVQDRNTPVEIQPMLVLSYYSSPTMLRESAYYLREIDEVNATGALHFAVQLVPDAASQSDSEMLQRHFTSIEQTNAYLEQHSPRAIDYFGRAMDLMTVRDYAPAIADLTRAIELAPDFALAYFQRAIARHKTRLTRNIAPDADANATGASQLDRRDLDEIFADLDMAARLSPSNPYIPYDKGNIYAEMQDLTSALSCYSHAIELKPDMGEAYYNRGFVYMKLGDRQRGLDDLSRAGELGVVPSYNLLKRMSN